MPRKGINIVTYCNNDQMTSVLNIKSIILAIKKETERNVDRYAALHCRHIAFTRNKKNKNKKRAYTFNGVTDNLAHQSLFVDCNHGATKIEYSYDRTDGFL